MASNSSPSHEDDFVMLDTRQIADLPLRRRQSVHEAEHESVLCSDDDLHHVSGPGSVRSLNTPSPVHSPVLSPAMKDDTALLPEPSHTHSQQHQTHQEHEPFGYGKPELGTQTSPIAQPKSPTCHNHATIDQLIMDFLIEHALTKRIEQEYGVACNNDTQLRQQMMTRFRSLPVYHSLVMGVIKRTRGRKILFQGQPRSSTDIEDIYRVVFTNVERMALNFLTECHMRRFEKGCSFYGSFMPTSRESLYHAMLQQGFEQGKSLALEVHSKVMEHLIMDSEFKEPFDDLRQPTRSWVDYPSWGTEVEKSTIRPPRDRLAKFKRILQMTIERLPNDRYSPDDPINCNEAGYWSPLKRVTPDDEEDEDCPSPPSKRIQTTSQVSEDVNDDDFELSICAINEEGTRIVAAENDEKSVCKRFLFLWNGTDSVWTLTDQECDYTTNLAIRSMNTKLERLYEIDKEARINMSFRARKHGELPFVVQMIQLEQQSRRRMRMLGHDIEHPFAGPVPLALPTVSDPLFQPVGEIYQTLRQIHVDCNDLLSTTQERVWLREHAERCAEMTSTEEKDEFVSKMQRDTETSYHIAVSGISVVEYVFIMDALLLLRCVELATVAGCFKEKSPATTVKPEDNAPKDAQVQPEMLEQPKTKEAESDGSEVKQVMTTVQSTARDQNRHPRQEYQLQLMLLEQQNHRRRPDRRVEVKQQLKQDEHSTARTEKGISKVGTDHNTSLPQVSSRSDTQSSALCDHGDDQSLSVPPAIEGREYRRGTLLARSTQHPPPFDITNKNTRSTSSGNLGNRTETIKECSSLTSSFAPVPLLWKQKTPLVDDCETGNNRVGITFPDIVDASASRFTIAPHQDDPSSAVIENSYQYQLMLLEQANRRRVMIDKQVEQQERNGHPTSVAQIWVNNGVTYIGFKHTHLGMDVQIVIRVDIESVDTDTLSTVFKDNNCLHASCEGWKCTAERIRESQKEHWMRLRERMDVVPGPKEESAHDMRLKRKENNIAWSLAELNPCLRSRATDEVLRTAVKHYISLKINSSPPDAQVKRTKLVEQPDAEPTQRRFIIQKPDDIMQDPDLEESSSSSEDEDECCDDASTAISEDDKERQHEVPFPRILLGEDRRYLMFWSLPMGNWPATYYTVRADLEKFSLSLCSTSFQKQNCICHRIWSIDKRDGEHDGDCEIAMKLARQNESLQGKENEEIRYRAAMNYALLSAVVWHENRTIKLEGLGPGNILNQKVPEYAICEAFALFSELPPPNPPKAQCRHCNMILERSGYVHRVVHMACCDVYQKLRAVKPSAMTYRQNVASW